MYSSSPVFLAIDARARAMSADAARCECSCCLSLTGGDLVLLQDKAEGYIWKLDDPQVLARERAAKLQGAVPPVRRHISALPTLAPLPDQSCVCSCAGSSMTAADMGMGRASSGIRGCAQEARKQAGKGQEGAG